jgi:hypothetical protein
MTEDEHESAQVAAGFMATIMRNEGPSLTDARIITGDADGTVLQVGSARALHIALNSLAKTLKLPVTKAGEAAVATLRYQERHGDVAGFGPDGYHDGRLVVIAVARAIADRSEMDDVTDGDAGRRLNGLLVALWGTLMTLATLSGMTPGEAGTHFAMQLAAITPSG